jgi:hypothetical protein
VFVVVALVAVIGVYADLHRDISLDEGFALETARRPIGEALDRAVRYEAQAPLYFAALQLWLSAGAALGVPDLLVWARLLSTACVVLALLAVHRASQLADPDGRGPDAALLLAPVPLVLWAASEARNYALTLLLVALLAWQWMRVWGVAVARPATGAAVYALLALLSVVTFYYSGFVVAGLFVGALLLGRRRASVLAHLGLGLALLPLLPTVREQAALHAPYAAAPPAREALALVAGARGLVGALFLGLPNFLNAPLTGALLAVAAGGLVLSWVAPRASWRRLDSALLVAALLPTVPLLVLRGWALAPVEPRHWTPMIVVPALVLATLLGRAPRARVAGIASVATLLLLGIAGVRFLQGCARGCVDRWRDAAAFVDARERPGEPILVFSPYGELQFRHAYAGRNPVRGIPRDDPWTGPELALLVAQPGVDDAARFGAAMDAAVRGAPAFWLVRWFAADEDRQVVPALDSALAARGVVSLRRSFSGGPLSGDLEVARVVSLPSREARP